MTIETDIKQTKPFRTNYQKMIVNVLYTGNWLSAESNNILKPFDLSLEQYNVLRILRGQYPKPIGVNAMIERMLNKMSNTSRLIDKLLTKKLVERTQCPNDRRAVDVLITKSGLDLLDKIDAQQIEWEKKLNNLSQEEAQTLSNLLDKLRT